MLNSLFYIALAQYPPAPYKSKELSSNTALYREDRSQCFPLWTQGSWYYSRMLVRAPKTDCQAYNALLPRLGWLYDIPRPSQPYGLTLYPLKQGYAPEGPTLVLTPETSFTISTCPSCSNGNRAEQYPNPALDLQAILVRLGTDILVPSKLRFNRCFSLVLLEF